MGRIEINMKEHELFAEYVKKLTGIVLDETKDYLVHSRLYKFLDITGSESFEELYHKVVADRTGALKNKVIDAITTNETSFFRDYSPFEMIKYKVIPDIIDKQNNSNLDKPLKLDIWSAACSTGQEVYTIGITLKEILGDTTKHNIRILGTDISDEAITKASHGYYSSIEMERGVEGHTKNRHFSHTEMGWKIDDEIRALATFKKFNLFDSYAGKGSFDIIFCRNVAIYFSEEDRKDIFTRLGQCLKPGGKLIIGSTESIGRLCPQYESHRHIRSVYYQLKE